MKILVVGGSSGLGKSIVEKYNADNISTSVGFPIPEKLNEAVAMSMNYDVVVNCLPDSNQNKLLTAMYRSHSAEDLPTYFITIGSMSWRLHQSGHSKRDLFDWNERILISPTKVRHTLLNPAYLWNSKDEGPVEKINEKEMLDTIDFLIQRSYTSASVISLLEIKGPFKC